MKKVIKWIILASLVLPIPYVFTEPDFKPVFFALLYGGLVVWLMISDLKVKK